MKPFGVDQPPRRQGTAAVLVVIAALIGVGALFAGIYLGVRDLSERRTASASTTVPTTTVVLPTTTEAISVTTTTSVTDPNDTMAVTDDSGALTVEVPVAWSDVSGDPWDRAGDPVGIQIGAAPDLDAWRAGWGTPGVFVGVSDSVAVDEAYGDWSDDCAARETDLPFVAAGLEGTLQVWRGCGVEGSDFLVGVATPVDGSFVLVFQAVVLGEADRAAADRVLATLSYQP